MTAFAFTNIGMLVALAALPAIWYFLRLMPPRPRLERFPPTRLLLDIPRKDEQPATSPWWLTALRLLLAAIVIVALAGPVFKPTAEVAPGTGPLLVVVDNGWTAAPHWTTTVDTAHRIVQLAEDAGRPISLLATAEPANQSLAPADASEILKRIDALQPRPWAPNRADLATPLANATANGPFGGVVWLSDGVGGPDVDAFAKFLGEHSRQPPVVYADTAGDLMGLKPPTSGADALTVPVIRRPSSQVAAGLVTARDIKGRVVGDARFSFAPGNTTTETKIALPIEIRNEIARLEIAKANSAGAVQLLDDRFRRRRIGLLSGTSAEAAQPLLSPLYYISRAVQPFADLRQPRNANAAVAVPELIDANCSVIAMADIGTLTPNVEQEVAKWVQNGGVLVRFAGPRLAAATDSLIPVTLRHGDRTLGGSLTWQTPQPLASFSQKSPFAGLAVPKDVTVTRQVLAEPDGMLANRTWAALADGTPLVTAAPLGKGWLILFHVTADTSWSNLPLSGTFVDMLRRIIAFSSGTGGAKSADASQPVAPYRLLDGYGHFVAPGAEAQPISGNIAAITPAIQHPPGLYGTEEGFRAVNLLGDKAELPALDLTKVSDISVRQYPTAKPTEVAPWLLGLAFLLLALDGLAVLWLSGAFRIRRRAATAAVVVAAVLAGATAAFVPEAHADQASDKFALEAVDKTHLAYVITGDPQVDEVSKAGLTGLSEVLAQRTALEPGDPMGVNPEHDELSFFPLIYWPIAPNTPMPSQAAMSKIDAYMRQGGSVLFDTRDQLERTTSFSTLAGTPAAERLKAMLANLDIPPLEPVPADHVLTKAFYLLNDFPGRYAGGPLWVEASDSKAQADRPVAAGDGVSTILITENDFAGAWARDAGGAYMFPTVPNDPRQREMAYRSGINIVMYTLTGNYKADQVHVPALLERLGQ
jgi:hypothetical protein